MTAEFEEWAVPAASAVLFGSAARGGMQPDNDIDVLVLRPDSVDADEPQWRTQLDRLASKVTAWTGNDTRILEFSVQEARAGLAGGDGVLFAARDEGLVLCGH
jgi:predicted nucleotidyltransferase